MDRNLDHASLGRGARVDHSALSGVGQTGPDRGVVDLLVHLVRKFASTVFGRWIVETLSWSSNTESPIVEPVTQWFGRGFGQKGSTSK